MQTNLDRTGKTAKLADGVCLLVALIWGSGFAASQYALNAGFSPSLIMALRFTVAAVALLPVCVRRLKALKRQDLAQGAVPGVFLFCAFYLQIFGQGLTTVSNAAFLTATNVVMVPFLVWAATKKPPPARIFLLAGTTLVGVGLLTLSFGQGMAFGMGDGIILLCAFGFALHIFYLGKAVAGRDALLITFVQMVTAALLSLLVLALFGRASIARADFSTGLLPVLYLGLFSTCVCYLMQTWAQKYTSPTKVGILLSTEGLFGALFSVLLGFEPLTPQMIAGGLVIFASVALTELPPKGGAEERTD